MRTSARQACSVASVLLGFATLGSSAAVADSVGDIVDDIAGNVRAAIARVTTLDLMPAKPAIAPPDTPNAAPPLSRVAIRPPTISKATTKAKDATLGSAAAVLAAARAAEKVADANLSAALEADEKADAAHDSAAAMAKAAPTPANLVRAREAAAADDEADARLTEALLADKVADENLKTAEKAFVAEKNGRGSATRKPGVRPTAPLTLATE